MEKILVLSNMYPSNAHPSYGVFVKNFEDNLLENNIKYEKVVMNKQTKKLLRLIAYQLFFVKVFFTVLLKKYAIIYIHYASITSIPVLWASKFKKMTIYTNVHGTDVEPTTEKEIRLERNTRKIIDRSKKVIVPSDYFKERVMHKYSVENDRVIVYPSGGIDQTIFYPKSHKDFREGTLVNDTEMTLGYVSRIEKEKGWRVLLQAISKLNSLPEASRIKLLIIGDGSERDELKKYSKELKIADIIEYHPFVNQRQLSEYYNHMDLFIFPTRKESLGLVGIEAMACGVPVIGSDIPALADYIKPNKNGFLFEKDNVEDLLNKILDYLKLSNEEREEMKSKAINTSSYYGKKNIKKTFKEIFK